MDTEELGFDASEVETALSDIRDLLKMFWGNGKLCITHVFENGDTVFLWDFINNTLTQKTLPTVEPLYYDDESNELIFTSDSSCIMHLYTNIN